MNNGYVGVYHLANGTTLHLNDSSAANNNLTNNNAGAAAGEIDGGASFNGGQYSYLNSPVLLPTGTAARSLSAWVQMTTNSNFEDNGEEIAGWGDNNGAGDRWAIFWTGSSMGIEGLNAGAFANMTFDTNWHYVVVTSPAGNSSFANASVYIDGVQQVLSSSSGSINTASSNVALGTMAGINNRYNYQGHLDEVRASN